VITASRVLLVTVAGAAVLFWHMWRTARIDQKLDEINKARKEIQDAHARAVRDIQGEQAAEKSKEAHRHLEALILIDQELAETEEAAEESRVALATKLNELF
jgi:hypothetical protein